MMVRNNKSIYSLPIHEIPDVNIPILFADKKYPYDNDVIITSNDSNYKDLVE